MKKPLFIGTETRVLGVNKRVCMQYYASEAQSLGTRSLLARVFMWMAIALTITGITAFFVSTQPQIYTYLFEHTGVLIGLMILQLIIVIMFSLLIYRVSYATALLLFLSYSFLTGVTFSALFLVYTMESLAITFFITAAMFGVMALYGYFTRADLSSLGSLLTMALVGIIIAMLINFFFKSSTLHYIISFIAVVVFAGLTAYDIQRIQQLANALDRNNVSNEKIALLGALTLYLDFINLFLNLLQFTGRRKE